MLSKFYLGAHMPHWLAAAGVPLFVSHTRLTGRRTFPRALTGWALDSGGFSEIQKHGRWTISPEDYVAAVRQYDLQIGNLEWAAPQDSMCERDQLAKAAAVEAALTGRPERSLDYQRHLHQERTVANFKRCEHLWYDRTDDESPIMPALQGDEPEQYVLCKEMYAAAGVDLSRYPLIGVGSICRRDDINEIGDVLTAILETDPDMPLHIFGGKTQALKKFGHLATTADSLAWSDDARKAARKHGGRLKLCDSVHPREAKNCANCLPYALQWRARVLDLPSTHYQPFPPEGMYLPYWAEAAA
jgi:hypothetical protein